MDNVQYYLKNLTEAIAKERADFATEIAKLQKSVNLGVIRKDFKELVYGRIGISHKMSYYGSDKIGISINKKDFLFKEENFLQNVTDYINSLLDQDEKTNAHNEEINSHNRAVCNAISVLVKNCGFDTEIKVPVKSRSWVRKYESKFLSLDSYLMPFYKAAPTYDIAARKKELFSDAERYLREFNDANLKKEQERKVKALADPLLAEAIAYLGSKGKKVGVDFTAETAVQDANDLAFELEIERLKKDGGPFSFVGQNCEDCDGWDGNDRRCNCGNRRVYWDRGYGHSFKNPVAEGYAD